MISTSKAFQQAWSDMLRATNLTPEVVKHYLDQNPLYVRTYRSSNDPVNHPGHYTDGKIEVSDFIADKNLNFFRGNVIKYICRAGKKDPDKEIEDLKKAQWYINREIERVEGKA